MLLKDWLELNAQLQNGSARGVILNVTLDSFGNRSRSFSLTTFRTNYYKRGEQLRDIFDSPYHYMQQIFNEVYFGVALALAIYKLIQVIAYVHNIS
jgi:hypothetical protein